VALYTSSKEESSRPWARRERRAKSDWLADEVMSLMCSEKPRSEHSVTPRHVNFTTLSMPGMSGGGMMARRLEKIISLDFARFNERLFRAAHRSMCASSASHESEWSAGTKR